MNKKILIVLLLIFTVTTLFIISLSSKKNSDISSTNATSTPDEMFRAIGIADWASNATTIDELTFESDLIAYVRVIEAPVTYVVEVEAPMMDENGNPVQSVTIKSLVSYTAVEVLETYLGKSSKVIFIGQSGGFNPEISKGVEEMADDPLYKTGEEYILFLINVSNNSVDPSIKELYRIVNPFGRYIINGNNVHSYGKAFGNETFNSSFDVNELKLQIQESIKLLPILTEIIVESLTPTLDNIIRETPTSTFIETTTAVSSETITPTP